MIHTKASIVQLIHSIGFVRLISLAIAIGAIVLSMWFRDQWQQFESLSYLGILLGSMIANASIVLPTPTLLLVAWGGSIFDPTLVGIVGAIGATIGDTSSYLLGTTGRGAIANRQAFDRVASWLNRYGWITLFFLAVIPNPLFDFGGIAAGVLCIPVRRFWLATVAGHTVKFLVAAHLGSIALNLD